MAREPHDAMAQLQLLRCVPMRSGWRGVPALILLAASCTGDGASDGRNASITSAPAARTAAAQRRGEATDARTVASTPELPARPAAVDHSTWTIGASSAPATHVAAGDAVLNAVRVGHHAAADRVAFEFVGPGLPAWQVEFVDRPLRDCGSGDTVRVAGDAWLQVQFNGAQAHSTSGEPTIGTRISTEGNVIREVVRTCDFEGIVTWVIGVARPNAYAAQRLAAPPRLVIDIAY